jgi:hypothetical protein
MQVRVARMLEDSRPPKANVALAQQGTQHPPIYAGTRRLWGGVSQGVGCIDYRLALQVRNAGLYGRSRN